MIPGKIISVINHKGGVGKTTTAVNLGEALARKGLRVLVVDLDSQCNATDLLLSGKDLGFTVFDVLNPDQEDPAPEKCIYPTHIPGLHCLPNRHDSIYLEPHLIGMGPAGFQLFRDRLQHYLRTSYDISIIDNPPNFGTFVASSLLASDYAIIPFDGGSVASLRGLMKALNFIEEIRETGNPGLKFLKSLMTKVDRRTSVWKTIIDQKTRELGENWLFRTVIPMNTEFQKAELSAGTIFQVKPRAPGAAAYSELAAEVLEDLDAGP
jgi:cellulose biosynthesis protein BcsQ